MNYKVLDYLKKKNVTNVWTKSEMKKEIITYCIKILQNYVYIAIYSTLVYTHILNISLSVSMQYAWVMVFNKQKHRNI